MIGHSRLRNNVVANLIGTAIVIAASVLSAPLIYRWLGPGAYGLVGVYVLLQTLLPLFDAGITAGLARAVAWHNSRSLGEVRTLVQTAQRPMIAMAAVLLLIAALGAEPAARHWLADSTLPFETVRIALWCMAGALAIRLVAGLGRATLMALELQPQANAIQALAATARTFGAIAFALATDTGIIGFFAFQIPISIAEYIAYRLALLHVLTVDAVSLSRTELLRHLRFAFGIAVLSAAWLLTSQVEKVLLATSLSLPGFGAYSLGVHVASVILLAVGAMHGAMLPRMTRHIADAAEAQLGTLYGVITTLTVAMSCTCVVAIAIGARTFLPSLSEPVDGIDPMRIAEIYGIGNAGVALLTMAYLLQNARGVLRLHTVGTMLHMFIQVPLLGWTAASGDAFRTAVLFACISWAFVLLWLPIVHKRFLPGGHRRWALTRLAPSLVAGIVAGAIAIQSVQAIPSESLGSHLGLAIGTVMTFAVIAAMDADVREIVRRTVTHAS